MREIKAVVGGKLVIKDIAPSPAELTYLDVGMSDMNFEHHSEL